MTKFPLAKALRAIGCIIAVTAAFTVLSTAPAFAKAKATTSTAKYCAAAKAWLAFENATLESGPYDMAWVAGTRKVVVPLLKTAPKPILGAMRVLALGLYWSRVDLAGVTEITSSSDIALLRRRAEDVADSFALLDARNAVGAYTLKTCKIDVLQPFRDLAKGFE